jgi:Stage II sporulation protein E (SpoIIE)
LSSPENVEDISIARRLCSALFVFLCLGWGGWAKAQSGHGVDQVQLGQSTSSLYGPWKFQVGDSPLDPVTHKPLWAEPDFDDSHWETVDLTPKPDTSNQKTGLSGWVPGWTAMGHPGYWGYAWYRIRVQVEARPGEQLALAGPPDMDDGYEVFANGRQVGTFGNFSGRTPVMYYTQPMMFPLPQPENGPSAAQVLAFRVWTEPNTLTDQPAAGGFHTPPVLGEEGAVAAAYQMRWLERVRLYALFAFDALLFALLAVVAFTLILFDLSDRVYLWVGTVFLLLAAYYGIGAFDSWTQHLSIFTDRLVSESLLLPLIWAGWVMVWWTWFGLHRPSWLPYLVAALTLLYMVCYTIGAELFYALFPHPVAGPFHIAALVLRLLLFGILLWVVIQGIRRQGVEGWLVLPAIPLLGIGMFSSELIFLHFTVNWFLFGIRIGLPEMAYLLLVAALALLLLHRLLLSVRRQRLIALDVKQAQEVQQVILPEAQLVVPGLAIESEYRPALEVGGDFFQIIPHPVDGSLLIVAGDVTGKGLKAGMLVALLVGSIRSTAQFDRDPVVMLDSLNQRLLGRGDAHATCLALRIAVDGEVTLANAGHMPPYLNGEPVAMEGALPLGMMPGAEFSVMRFKLAEGDRLMLLSDGIVEAMDDEGHLFGFERVHDLLHTKRSAAEVASAAQSFGQEDDISVISVTRTRTAVMEPAFA